MIRVKICGITRMEDAMAAAEEGASALGFIFFPPSPRYIDSRGAAAIIREIPPFVTPVGVFVNETREEILRTIDATGIRCLQLHGDELPEDTAGYDVPVIKSFRVGDGFDVAAMAPYRAAAYLLDASAPGMYGGTGKTFDWRVARRASETMRIILSGGISPENVARAAAEVMPYAVDLSSGVESAPGIKDRRKIRELFERLKGVPAPRPS
ncbi:MAG TPA: phosphoribosylanthranilate isomerase [Bacteroidota bacterium]|nr:phosphoribosylanthranilate isomerase [Bacteroidota bacterium]